MESIFSLESPARFRFFFSATIADPILAPLSCCSVNVTNESMMGDVSPLAVNLFMKQQQCDARWSIVVGLFHAVEVPSATCFVSVCHHSLLLFGASDTVAGLSKLQIQTANGNIQISNSTENGVFVYCRHATFWAEDRCLMLLQTIRTG